MSNSIDSSFSIGPEFLNILQNLDTNNAPVDDPVQKYLDENPDGLSFTYKDKEYLLVKKGDNGPVQLFLIENGQSFLKDPVVQINSQYTPDGSIEIGGLTEQDHRIYITRSSDNEEEIIAFAAEDGWTVDRNYSNAVVLYSGSAAVQPQSTPISMPPLSVENDPPVTIPPVLTPSSEPAPITNTTPDDVSVERQTVFLNRPFVNASSLQNGIYVVENDLLLDSVGNVLGRSWHDDGVYQVRDRVVYHEVSAADGKVVYLPIHAHDLGYRIGQSFIDENGILSQNLVNYQFLRDSGIATDEIYLSYLFPRSTNDLASFDQFTVRNADDRSNIQLIVVGTGANEIVLGRAASLEEGTYVLKEDSTGKTNLYMESLMTEIVTGTGNTTKYLQQVYVYSGTFVIDTPIFVFQDESWLERDRDSILSGNINVV